MDRITGVSRLARGLRNWMVLPAYLQLAAKLQLLECQQCSVGIIPAISIEGHAHDLSFE